MSPRRRDTRRLGSGPENRLMNLPYLLSSVTRISPLA